MVWIICASTNSVYIIRKYSIDIHCFADDELFLSMKSHDTGMSQRQRPEWLNNDKTENIIFGPKSHINVPANQIAILDSITLASSNTVKNLGVIFDEDMSSNADIKQICSTALLHPCTVSKIGSILLQGDTQKRVHAFITSNLTMAIHYYFHSPCVCIPLRLVCVLCLFISRCLCSLFHVSSLSLAPNQSWQTSRTNDESVEPDNERGVGVHFCEWFNWHSTNLWVILWLET